MADFEDVKPVINNKVAVPTFSFDAPSEAENEFDRLMALNVDAEAQKEMLKNK